MVFIAIASGLDRALPYGVFLAILLGGFLLGEASPQRMLALFSGVIILLLATGMAAITRKRWTSALTWVVIPWAVVVLLGMGWAAIFG